MSIPPPQDWQSQPTQPMTQEMIKWSRTERRVVRALVAIVVIVIVVVLMAMPFFDRTREARHEVVSMTQEYWVTRDARFDASLTQGNRTGFWCSYYVYGVLDMTEREGLGGNYQLHFTNSPEGNTQDFSVYFSANQHQAVNSGDLCANSPDSVVSYTVTPPRIYEKFNGIAGGNPVWELHGKLTLRELEGTGGDYVVRFDVMPGPLDSYTVTMNILSKGVQDFDVSFSVPSGTGYTISYYVNAPRVQERVSLIQILTGLAVTRGSLQS